MAKVILSQRTGQGTFERDIAYLNGLGVGLRDWHISGKQKDIVTWALTYRNKKITVEKAFGDQAWIILRGKAAKVGEEFMKAYAGAAAGLGGASTLVTFAGARFLGPAASAFHDLASNPSDLNLDNLVGSCCSNAKVSVILSAAKGTYSNSLSAKDSVVSLKTPSDLMWFAVALSNLKW